MAERKRIEWVDCAKGIAILLVIVGHTVSKLYGIIYSFHMPLFFALSCFTYRFSTDSHELAVKTKSAFRHLILPGIYTYLATIAYFILNNFSSFLSFDYCKLFLIQKIETLLYASAVDVDINGVKVEAIGSIWFLAALFLGRTLFDYLRLKISGKKLFLLSILLSVSGVLTSKIVWLPLSIDIAFALLPVFYFGSVLDRFNVEKRPCFKLMIYGILWILTFLPVGVWLETCLDIGWRSYPLYPVCFLTAIFGTLMIVELSVILVKWKRVLSPLLYLGKNSLYMLLIHYVDTWFYKLWIVEDNEYYTAFYRIVLDALLFMAVMFWVEKIRKYRGTILRSHACYK